MTEAPLPLVIRAGALLRALPDFPGKDTLHLLLARAARRFDMTAQGTYAGGLRFEGNPAIDGNSLDLFFLRHSLPALAPVLDAALEAGSVFADVGANQGMYTLYAARRVGAGGQIHAFEPVPNTIAKLRRNLELNGFSQVTCVASAAGAQAGTITLHINSGASGLASRYTGPEASPIEVPVTTLDSYFRGRSWPQLVKIDVEGMEMEVLKGMPALLGGSKPPVLILETQPSLLAAAGSSYREILDYLARAGGYVAWSLTRSGLRREIQGARIPGSLNTLATRPGLPLHDKVAAALQNVRFTGDPNA